MSKFNLYVRENMVEQGMDVSVYDPKEKKAQVLVENDTINDLETSSTWRPISSEVAIGISQRVSILEENIYEFEVYENVTSGTSGQVTIFPESEIRLGQYVDGQDCLVVKVDANAKPIDDPARTADGTVILATLDALGNYTLSGTPTSYPVSVVYQVTIPSEFLSNIPLDSIVNSSHVDQNDQYTGTGSLNLPQYTVDAIAGTITVDDLTVALFKYPQGQGRIKRFNITGNTFSVPNQTVSYIVANYNSGAPEIQITTDVSIINETTVCPILTLTRFNGNIKVIDWNTLGRAKVDKIHQSIVKTQRFRRESGLILSTSGTRNIDVSSGHIWIGAVDAALDEVNSIVADSVKLFYHVAGAWESTSITQFNNTQYDNGTNLVTLSNNRYAVNWVYRCVAKCETAYVLLGSGDYKLQEALNSTEPIPPPEITSHSVLVGRIVVEKNANDPATIQSAFDIQFSGGAPRIHSDLLERDAVNSHPATAVSFSGEYLNVQLGLAEALDNRAVDLQRDTLDYTLKHWWDHTQSAGRIYGGQIVENPDGTINVSAGVGIVKSGSGGPDSCACDENSSQISSNSFIAWEAKENMNLFDNAYNYIYVDGTDKQIKTTTDYYSIDFYNSFTIGRAYRKGTHVVARLCGTNLWNFNRRVQLFGEEVFPVVRATGLIIADAGDRRFSCTSGILWAELVNRFPVTGKASAAEFTYWWRDGAGGWTSTTATQINNTGYDNNAGSPTVFGGGINRWRADFVYVVHDSTYHVVMGQTEAASLAEAESLPVTEPIPGLLAAYSTLLGRIIIQKNETVLYVSSAFTEVFATSGVTNHNDLAGREEANAHPISAITGLQATLDNKMDDYDMVGGANYNFQ